MSIKKIYRRARAAYKAVLVLSGLTAIALAIAEELTNVEKRRRGQEAPLLPRETQEEGITETQEATTGETA